jgi:hypothetical protein
MTSQEIKAVLHESIENIDDNDFLLAIKNILERKYRNEGNMLINDWQIKRIEESHSQIRKGNCFSNRQADLMVEKWLKE